MITVHLSKRYTNINIKDKEENRKYQREWARKNSRTKKANQVGAKRRKQMVDDAKSHPCVICNKDYPVEVMDLYHIDQSEKASSISKLMCISSYSALKEEIDKCAPLCANCHRLLDNGYVQLPELIVIT